MNKRSFPTYSHADLRDCEQSPKKKWPKEKKLFLQAGNILQVFSYFLILTDFFCAVFTPRLIAAIMAAEKEVPEDRMDPDKPVRYIKSLIAPSSFSSSR